MTVVTSGHGYRQLKRTNEWIPLPVRKMSQTAIFKTLLLTQGRTYGQFVARLQQGTTGPEHQPKLTRLASQIVLWGSHLRRELRSVVRRVGAGLRADLQWVDWARACVQTVR